MISLNFLYKYIDVDVFARGLELLVKIRDFLYITKKKYQMRFAIRFGGTEHRASNYWMIIIITNNISQSGLMH